MSEVLTDISDSEAQSLVVLRGLTGEQYQPSQESIDDLLSADLVLMSGQFVGAGKSTFIQALEDKGRMNVPSWTNRDLRPGEVEGKDKCKVSLGQLATAAESGELLELEEIRPGIFYATPAKLLRTYSLNVKDLELKGALRLRKYAPELPIIVPVPPLHEVNTSAELTEWERRVAVREGYQHSISDKNIQDLRSRLEGVVEEVERISSQDLISDPHIAIIVNDYLPEALRSMQTFLATGEKPQRLDELGGYLRGIRLAGYLHGIKVLAATALAA